MNSEVGEVHIKLNGKVVGVDSSFNKLITNYPGFDTLAFISESANGDETFLCNFKPDSSYTITMACCGSLDIISAAKLKNDSLKFWDMESDLEKIQGILADKPFISVKTKKKSKQNILAWHADASCLTQHSTINKKPWKMGVPPKCFYWNNITCIMFFKIDNSMKPHKKTDVEEFLGIDNLVELNSISFRLFDNKTYLIVYDEENNTIELRNN